MIKKYLVIGDYVISKSDGQRHYVTAKELVKLYGVKPSECELFETREPRDPRKVNTNLIVLKPLYNGDYSTYLDSIKSKAL